MVKLVPVGFAAMVSVGNAPPIGQDLSATALHPAQVETLVDRIAEILVQRGTGAFALLRRWHAAGDGNDPDLFVMDLQGSILFGAPRTVVDACADRFVEACVLVVDRFGSGWIDGPAPGGGSWSYVRQTWIDGTGALVGARARMGPDGTLSPVSPAR